MTAEGSKSWSHSRMRVIGHNFAKRASQIAAIRRYLDLVQLATAS